MPNWPLFAGVVVALTAGVLVLARLTHRAILPPTGAATGGTDPDEATSPPATLRGRVPSTRALLVNVAVTQGLVGVGVGLAAWYARVPAGALGLGDPPIAGIPIGLGLGLALAAANEAGERLAVRVGYDPDNRLRSLLAPDTRGDWVWLVVVVLPLIAGAEELLFRAALIGGLSAGFALSPWLLAVGSSAAFGLAHGIQGPAGVAVTGALGLVLAAAFVLTGSLLVVIVAHYVVNVVEFAVHEGMEPGL